MKNHPGCFLSFLCLFGSAVLLQGASGGANQSIATQLKTLPADKPYTVTRRDANSRVWERTIYEQLPSGQIVSKKVHFTDLESGLHYKDANGQWVESQEQIETYATGAIARQGQYQVIFANNLNTAGSIDMQTPDGKRLRSNILGLSYYDSSTGQSVLIAQIQDSQGELISSNQVLYPNAFDGVKADVRYTYKKGNFEQDVILLEQPPAPASLGLNPETTVIEVMTEFINPPAERIKEIQGKSDLQPDQDISWGAMRIGHGKAFDLGQTPEHRPLVQVMKEYATVGRRKILLEKVPLPNISASLSQLPKQASIKSKLPVMLSKGPQLPQAPLAQTQQKPMKLVVTTPSNKGYVLDYVVLNTDQTDFTFQSDEGYRVKGSYNLSGTTTFEGGTVIKCNQDGQINIDSSGAIVCKTSAYRPAVFTSNNDDGIGAPGYWVDYPDTDDPYYTGTPSLGDVNTFLNISCANPVLRNLRFCYANQALTVNSSAGSIDLWDCQFMNASICIWAENIDVNLHNVLIQVISGRPIYLNYGGNFFAENLTADGFDPDDLVYFDDGQSQAVVFTNSIATYGQYVSLNGGPSVLSSDPIYQVVGGGSYYLTNGSPYRNAGTTNISPALLAELRQKTTYPPVVYDTVTFDTDTTFSPQVQRDTDTPDLGYHYDPLDYVIISGELVSNLTLTAGTSVGFYDAYGYGLYFTDGSSLTVNGTLTAPCWIASYNTVQEGGNGNWPISLGTALMQLDGNGTIKASFSRWPAFYASDAPVRNGGATGSATFANSEFYSSMVGGYGGSLYCTNCLFDRVDTFFWDQGNATTFAYQNCTFFNGFMALTRYHTSQWTIKNTAFDGTGFLTVDMYVYNTNYTHFDYNAYNTNNTSWATYQTGYWSLSATQTNGIHTVTNTWAWQSSWFGDFYQATNSPLINAGSPTADQVGLFNYTTQTNQFEETNSLVDIGYHYMALDANGNILDNDMDGVPDWQDANPNDPSIGTLIITIDNPTNGMILQ